MVSIGCKSEEVLVTAFAAQYDTMRLDLAISQKEFVTKRSTEPAFILPLALLLTTIWLLAACGDKNTEAGVDADVLRQVLGVSPQSLEGAIQAMEANYGSIDGYIEQGFGIDAATRVKLRELLLE